MIFIKKTILVSMVIFLVACSSAPVLKVNSIQPEPNLRPTRQKQIAGDISLNANNSDSQALLGGLADSAGFIYKQSSSFKVSAAINNITVEDAIAQLAVQGNKIAIFNYHSRTVMLLSQATIKLKMPEYLANRVFSINAGWKKTKTNELSINGSGSYLDSHMSQVRQLLEEDMTKVEVSMESANAI